MVGNESSDSCVLFGVRKDRMQKMQIILKDEPDIASLEPRRFGILMAAASAGWARPFIPHVTLRHLFRHVTLRTGPDVGGRFNLDSSTVTNKFENSWTRTGLL
jgi:hypothetical protein